MARPVSALGAATAAAAEEAATASRADDPDDGAAAAAGSSRDAEATEATAGPDGEAIAGELKGATPQITQRIGLLRELRVAVQRRATLHDQLATTEAQVAQRQEQRLAAAEEPVALARDKRPLAQTQQALLAAETAYLEERADLPWEPLDQRLPELTESVVSNTISSRTSTSCPPRHRLSIPLCCTVRVMTGRSGSDPNRTWAR